MTLTAAGTSNIPIGSSINPIREVRDYRIKRIRRESILSRISDFKGMAACGEALSIRHEYTGGEQAVQNVSISGKVKPIVFSMPREVRFTIDDKLAWAVQVSACDYQKIMAHDRSLITEIIDYHNEETMLALDARAIWKIMAEANKYNRGKKAGAQTRSYDLGTQTSPIEVSTSSIWSQVRLPRNVINQQMIGSPSKMYVLHAYGLMDYVVNNHALSAYYMNGQCHSCQGGGSWGEMRDIDGVDFINHNCLPTDVSADGSITAPFIFGYKEALWSSYQMRMATKQGGVGDDNNYFESYIDCGLFLVEPRLVGWGYMKIPQLKETAQSIVIQQ